MLMRITKAKSISAAVSGQITDKVSVNFGTILALEIRVGNKIYEYYLTEVFTLNGSGTLGACEFYTDWFDLKLEPAITVPFLANKRVLIEFKSGTGESIFEFSILDDDVKVLTSGKKFVQVLGVLFGGFRLRTRLKLKKTHHIIQNRSDWRRRDPRFRRFLKK